MIKAEREPCPPAAGISNGAALLRQLASDNEGTTRRSREEYIRVQDRNEVRGEEDKGQFKVPQTGILGKRR